MSPREAFLAGRPPEPRRLIGRLHANLELWPHVFRDLDHQIAHAMGNAALPGSAREAHLDCLDDAGREWTQIGNRAKRTRHYDL